MRTKRFFSFFLILFLVLSLIPLYVKADIATFGKEDVGGSHDSWPTNYMGACKYSLTEAGTITNIAWYTTTVGTANTTCALYSDNAGSPNVLLAQSNAQNSVNGWNEYALTVPYLAAIGTYWLAYHPNGAVFYFAAGVTNQHAYKQPIVAPNLPDPFAKNGFVGDNEVSIHADYTPSGEGQNVTFGLTENLYLSAYNHLGKELAFQTSSSFYPSGTGFFWKAISGILAEFVSTNTIYPTANLLFNKELAFWKYENLFNSATSTMTKAIQLTLFELFDIVKLHASNIMLPGWTALTIEIAVAIGVLALVLAICGISLVVLRRRRD